MSSSTILETRVALGAGSWPAALAGALTRAITRIRSRRRLRRHGEALTTLDDRTLRDIGLSRGELDYAMPRRLSGWPLD